MLDNHIRPVINPILDKFAAALVDKGYGPNTITLWGVGFALATFLVLPFGAHGLALVFILLNRLADGLDGAVARLRDARGLDRGITDIGGFFDIVSDFIFYAGVVFFFGLSLTGQGHISAFLIFSFMGTSTSFLAYAILAEKRGVEIQQPQKRSFVYLSGLAEGTETFIFLVLICLFPVMYPMFAIIFAILCWITTYGRIRQAMVDFGDVEKL